MSEFVLPEPALVVLVGAPGSGKSSWATGRFDAAEIVSSDALRAVVGSGIHDLSASADAFALVESIVAARLRRGLTTVVDSTGMDAGRRRRYREIASAAKVPAVAVLVDAPSDVVHERNSSRAARVPARVVTDFLAKLSVARTEIAGEDWAAVHVVGQADSSLDAAQPGPARQVPLARGEVGGIGLWEDSPGEYPRVVLALSRFPADVDLAAWLGDVALAADSVGLRGIALMDHLMQIPQVGRAWEPIPEAYVTLGLLAGLDTRLMLGTLVSPVTWRSPGVLAKSVATLDALSGGRAFCGLGAGWWEREHVAYGVPFPSARERVDALSSAAQIVKALWAPGTKPFAGVGVALPETTCYPRPVSNVPVIVGGSGRRVLGVAARWADACNLRFADAQLEERMATFRSQLAAAGREPDAVHVTVLDTVARGRSRQRYEQLARAGVSTVFVAPEGVATVESVEKLGWLAR